MNHLRLAHGKPQSRTAGIVGQSFLVAMILGCSLWAQVIDPGVRTGVAGAGGFQNNIRANEKLSEPSSTAQFNQVFLVTGGKVTNNGLGPRFSSNSCVSCHAQPAAGGSSPQVNPLGALATLNGAKNNPVNFESGPILVPRFAYQLTNSSLPDGGVKPVWVVTGRKDAGACSITQPDFAKAATQNNLYFRQPLPLFGDGYIEFIQNSDIFANMNANINLKRSLGIRGVPQITDDGSISRLGWKAQWRALLPAIGAEENLEMGITNELFPTETDQTASCLLNPLPEDILNYAYTNATDTPWSFLADVERNQSLIRFLAAPIPGACPGGVQSSCTNGEAQFKAIGCVLCHTTSFTVPAGSIPSQGNTTIAIQSDLLLHHMGSCLADNITQGAATGDMWRTPPLWNVGQRIWFMHDGRTSNMITAIQNHFCAANPQYPASEANGVINAYNALSQQNQQDLINWLRSL
ncbi:MAG: hypothetical protein H0X25_21350 [Acidobacteriales bacterium]|nr:hypothetical protein [Terriglobales bacterium]